MFINCPYCRALVATDLATDLPPPLCPQCKGPLREQAAEAKEPSDAHASVAGSAPNDSAVNDSAEAASTIAEPPIAGPSETFDDAQRDARTDDAANDADADADDHDHDHDQHEYASMLDEFETSDDDAPSSANDERSAELADELGHDHDATMETPEAIAAIDGPLEAAQEAQIETSQDTPVQTPVAMAPTAPRATARRRAGQTAPSFVRAASREGIATSRARRWPAIVAIAALSATLVLQTLLADRARLAESARWRPLLETLCGVLSCDLPPWREPDAFALLQRDVRQHPKLRGALRVTASFRNDARWPQPWPKLHVTLSDVNGRPAGERSFEAREYLGGPPAQAMLGSGETATVAMDVLEPAAQTVAYDMRFR